MNGLLASIKSDTGLILSRILYLKFVNKKII